VLRGNSIPVRDIFLERSDYKSDIAASLSWTLGRLAVPLHAQYNIRRLVHEGQARGFNIMKQNNPLSLTAGSLLILVLSGCGKPSSGPRSGAPGTMPPPPVVRITEAKLEVANTVEEYIAHVEPIQRVDLMAQVSGVIKDMHFTEGSRVTEGDLLFTIDSAIYEATLSERKAELAQARAALDRAKKFLAMLVAADNRSVSKSDMDGAEARVAEAEAQVMRSEAAVKQADIDVGYTRIYSPIDGRIGRALITKGNLVSPSSGPLATVIQVDPIRVVFALPDAEYLTAFERYSIDAEFDPRVTVRLANEVVLPDAGTIAFDDNQMNPATGTIDIRMQFPNPKRLLVPNNFVTIMVSENSDRRKVLIPSDAVLYGADGTYVWCMQDDKTVIQKPVVTGAMLGTRQIIESGLEAGARVVTAGIQNLRPGITVSPLDSQPTK
jgi:membrane fusion protein (multidrug efflux system)